MNPYVDLESLRHMISERELTPSRRQELQDELARRSTPADRAHLDAMLRRLPAQDTADIRDLLYR